MDTQNYRESSKSGRGSRVFLGLMLLGSVLAGPAVAEDVSSALTTEQPVVVNESGPAVDLVAETSQLVLTETTGIALAAPEVVDIAARDTAAVVTAPENKSDAGQSDEYLVSASVDPREYSLPGQDFDKPRNVKVAKVTGGVSTSHGQDDQSLPYALILALIALIGLVPVSRRNLS
jgi:hypothetical protein